MSITKSPLERRDTIVGEPSFPDSTQAVNQTDDPFTPMPFVRQVDWQDAVSQNVDLGMDPQESFSIFLGGVDRWHYHDLLDRSTVRARSSTSRPIPIRNSVLIAQYNTRARAAQPEKADPERHDDLLRKIDEVERHASEPDWDGDGAVPLAAGTAATAKDLVRCFPPFDVSPEVSASPRGEIDFDWDIERNVSLIICVCGPPRHDIVFLAENEGSEIRGREPWKGELPRWVGCCFEHLKGYL